jgi:hypothetical protein
MGERNMSGRLANRMARSGHPRATLSEHMRLIGAKRMGRVQLQCRRALIALSRVRIGDLLVWAYPHVTEFKHWDRKSIHRAIIKVGIPVGKTRERCATTWVLRTQHDATWPNKDQ